MTPVDDLGVAYAGPRPARRVVSLVPSLTETLASADPGALVGATTWCTHPADLDVTRVRGTKNPDLAAVRALEPDVVVANREENRELDVRRLRDSGVEVWVTDIRSVDDAFGSIRRLLAGLGWDEPSWVGEAERALAPRPRADRPRVAVPIWRDPWMVVGPRTFTDDMLDRLGHANVFADAAERYPHSDVAEIERRRPDVVLLPDEPYVFTSDDGPEAFSQTATRLVSGRHLTWYGPAMIEAHAALRDL
jgi:ABC-type Fe3+-hydroxamate transport system substrate-binding protein